MISLELDDLGERRSSDFLVGVVHSILFITFYSEKDIGVCGVAVLALF